MSLKDARKLASFFGGEGSAFLKQANSNRRIYAQVSVANTERDHVERFVRATCLGTVVRRRSTKVNQSDVFIWRCFATGAISFLRQIRHRLPMKSPIVGHVLWASGQMEADRRLAYAPDWQREVLQRSKDLNERGPAGANRRMEAARPEHLDHLRRLIIPIAYEVRNRLGVLSTLAERDQLAAATLPAGTAVCPSCGGLFQPPKYPTPSRPGTSCGKRTCAYAQRRRRGAPCNVLHEDAAQTIAELLESEGSIEIVRSGRTVHGRVDFGNTEKGIVEVVAELVGVGSITERPPKKATHATSWHLRLQSDGAHGVIEQVYRPMTKKKRQAELLMYVHERLQHPRSRVNRRQWQDDALLVSRLLNKKGPVEIPDEINLHGLWTLRPTATDSTNRS